MASIVSDSVKPHRRQPTRLPHPWDSPGKNTGVGCHFLLQCIKVESESEVAQSCPTLSDLMGCSPPGSSIRGIFQARALEWGGIAFSEPIGSHIWPERNMGCNAFSAEVLPTVDSSQRNCLNPSFWLSFEAEQYPWELFSIDRDIYCLFLSEIQKLSQLVFKFM